VFLCVTHRDVDEFIIYPEDLLAFRAMYATSTTGNAPSSSSQNVPSSSDAGNSPQISPATSVGASRQPPPATAPSPPFGPISAATPLASAGPLPSFTPGEKPPVPPQDSDVGAPPQADIRVDQIIGTGKGIMQDRFVRAPGASFDHHAFEFGVRQPSPDSVRSLIY